MYFLGIDWVGVNAVNGRKLVLSIVFIAVVVLGSRLLRWSVGFALSRADTPSVQAKFWTRQGVSLAAAVILILGLFSIWFNDPTRLATAFGLMSAGLAFALQQVITSVAGYFVVLRGNTFTVGDRISMGGVRGDVMRLGFIQTTIMEMGQPGGASGDASMWVRSRQFTGRIVTVSNAKIFDEPVFNYTRDFPYIWEEMIVPVTYAADRARAEAIMLEATRRHAVDPDAMAAAAKNDLQQRFGVEPVDLTARVFYRITDNWLELTVRFVVGTHNIRGTKDNISRDMLALLDEAGIGSHPQLTTSSVFRPSSLSRAAATKQARETSRQFPARLAEASHGAYAGISFASAMRLRDDARMSAPSAPTLALSKRISSSECHSCSMSLPPGSRRSR